MGRRTGWHARALEWYGLAIARSAQDHRAGARFLASRKLEGHVLPGYIAVEGPIGVVKTTLANKLAQTLGYPLLRDPAAENPFLDRYYREG